MVSVRSAAHEVAFKKETMFWFTTLAVASALGSIQLTCPSTGSGSVSYMLLRYETSGDHFVLCTEGTPTSDTAVCGSTNCVFPAVVTQKFVIQVLTRGYFTFPVGQTPTCGGAVGKVSQCTGSSDDTLTIQLVYDIDQNFLLMDHYYSRIPGDVRPYGNGRVGRSSVSSYNFRFAADGVSSWTPTEGSDRTDPTPPDVYNDLGIVAVGPIAQPTAAGQDLWKVELTGGTMALFGGAKIITPSGTTSTFMTPDFAVATCEDGDNVCHIAAPAGTFGNPLAIILYLGYNSSQTDAADAVTLECPSTSEREQAGVVVIGEGFSASIQCGFRAIGTVDTLCGGSPSACGLFSNGAPGLSCCGSICKIFLMSQIDLVFQAYQSADFGFGPIPAAGATCRSDSTKYSYCTATVSKSTSPLTFTINHNADGNYLAVSREFITTTTAQVEVLAEGQSPLTVLGNVVLPPLSDTTTGPSWLPPKGTLASVGTDPFTFGVASKWAFVGPVARPSALGGGTLLWSVRVSLPDGVFIADSSPSTFLVSQAYTGLVLSECVAPTATCAIKMPPAIPDTNEHRPFYALVVVKTAAAAKGTPGFLFSFAGFVSDSSKSARIHVRYGEPGSSVFSDCILTVNTDSVTAITASSGLCGGTQTNDVFVLDCGDSACATPLPAGLVYVVSVMHGANFGTVEVSPTVSECIGAPTARYMCKGTMATASYTAFVITQADNSNFLLLDGATLAASKLVEGTVAPGDVAFTLTSASAEWSVGAATPYSNCFAIIAVGPLADQAVDDVVLWTVTMAPMKGGIGALTTLGASSADVSQSCAGTTCTIQSVVISGLKNPYGVIVAMDLGSDEAVLPCVGSMGGGEMAGPTAGAPVCTPQCVGQGCASAGGCANSSMSIPLLPCGADGGNGALVCPAPDGTITANDFQKITSLLAGNSAQFAVAMAALSKLGNSVVYSKECQLCVKASITSGYCDCSTCATSRRGASSSVSSTASTASSSTASSSTSSTRQFGASGGYVVSVLCQGTTQQQQACMQEAICLGSMGSSQCIQNGVSAACDACVPVGTPRKTSGSNKGLLGLLGLLAIVPLSLIIVCSLAAYLLMRRRKRTTLTSAASVPPMATVQHPLVVCGTPMGPSWATHCMP